MSEESKNPNDSNARRNDFTMAEMRKEAFAANVCNQLLEHAAEKDFRPDYTLAAVNAGYPEKTARQMAYYLMYKSDARDRIKARLAAAGISDAEIIGVPATIVRHSIKDCIDINEDGSWSPNLVKAVETGAIDAIKKLGYDAKGKPTLEMYDKLRASDQLASIRGLKRAEVKPDDAAVRRLRIIDNIRLFREDKLRESGGDESYADRMTEEYKAYLRSQAEYAPFMSAADVEDQNDHTGDTDPSC